MMTISVSGCSSVYAKNSIQSPGKKRSTGVQLLVDEYILKLKHYCSVDDVLVRSNPKNARDVRAQVEDEDAAVIGHIGSDDWVVMLDENGLDIGSEKMAELVGDAGNTGASRLSFCIGGPYGHGRKMRERANMSIKLSSMVLNHQIALLVLMEQLYSETFGLFKCMSPITDHFNFYSATASGPGGNNREYLFKLEKALNDIGESSSFEVIIENYNIHIVMRKRRVLGIVEKDFVIKEKKLVGSSHIPLKTAHNIMALKLHRPLSEAVGVES
ncbi:hypothetical protein EZV62_013746 [Acer yangbiense]|uniref:RNA methyltransferase n=1 Tax=Acer yangbiense TaxID=1000413 RepID=A0A5C7HYX9_9ROSI|nr:hypothetical protein EZV62_013746 [Acer yangbiense]